MNALPYPIVSKKNPILTVYVRGMDLADIVSVGETALYIKRVGDVVEYAKYYPFEERTNQLTFAFDDVVFNRPGGRFIGRLVYKGVTVSTIEFVYDSVPVLLVGKTNV
jgi:hypothetical protein